MEQKSSTMENMVNKRLFGEIYKGKKVLITGHTGFKGSWLSLWLSELGADVYGVALLPPSEPNHFDLLKLKITSTIQDINDYYHLEKIVKEINPEIIFHLAAQPLVRLSYDEPLKTISTNVIGTANLLEAAKSCTQLKAIVVITSDKCYDNKEWVWGYRENEALGGKDPYSASKGCTEIVSAAYRNSYFNNSNKVLLATARAGNVIGGGDWAKDRIITDIVQAANTKSKLHLRYPKATRPWQYVLEPLSGYLCLGWKLLEGNATYAEAWNFGPYNESNVSVLNLVKVASSYWSDIMYEIDKKPNLHEAGFLMLDSTKAIRELNWQPIWGFQTTVEKTILWYKNYYERGELYTLDTLMQYIADAQKLKVLWSNG